MNLHALRIFTNVAKLGGITAAANEMRLSQPAVTIQIRNLESEVGAKLIEGGETIGINFRCGCNV